MRTKTEILWTTIAIGFLLQYTEVLVLADPKTATSAPTKPTSTEPTPAKSTSAEPPSSIPTTTNPTTAAPTTTKSISAKTSPSPTAAKPDTSTPIPTKPTTANPTAAKPTTAEPNNTTLPRAGSTLAESISTKPTRAHPALSEPTHAKFTSAKPTDAASALENSSHTESTHAEHTPEKSTNAEPTHSKPTPTKPTSAKPTSANPAGADPAPAGLATPGPTSVVSTTRHSVITTNQVSTLAPRKLEDPIDPRADTKPSTASTPGPVLTSQDQFRTSKGPALTTVLQPETIKPIIREPFNEEISKEDIQDPKKMESTSVQICQKLLKKLSVTGNCSLAGEKVNSDYTFTSVSVTVDPSAAQEIYDEMNTVPTPVPHTLIAILSSCGALMLILVCFALYCMYHHRSYRKNQQHLTEELQTVENGYHDNPTLEVMEVQPEMQEKKVALNGEFNDSWIVPFDNLAKEDIPDEEDTHL